MMQNHGVSFSYEKAWHSSEKTLEMVREIPEKSYAKLPSQLLKLKETNPESVTDFVTNVMGRFKYMYMALVASIQGWKHCKPILVVGGICLEAVHRGH